MKNHKELLMQKLGWMKKRKIIFIILLTSILFNLNINNILTRRLTIITIITIITVITVNMPAMIRIS